MKFEEACENISVPVASQFVSVADCMIAREQYFFDAGAASRDEEVEKLKAIISGKTFYDVQKATAQRCMEIAENFILQPAEGFVMCADTIDIIADAIKEEFGL